jgi:hypothetical protein
MGIGYLNSEAMGSRQGKAISGEQYFFRTTLRSGEDAGSVAFVALLRRLLLLGVLAGVGRE